jgi:hypothetical protein
MIDLFLVRNQFPGKSLTLLLQALKRFGNCFSTWETTTTTMNEITDVVVAKATAMVVVNGRRLNRILRRR